MNTLNSITRKYCILNIMKAMPTFYDNLLAYLFFKKSKKGPLFVSWDYTSMCNFKCRFCGRWKLKQEDLSTKQRINIIKQLGKSGVKILSLCGGEPLLSKDLFLIIEEAKKQDMYVNVSTNGFLLKTLAKTLVNSDLDCITISIESHKECVHDSIRAKGSFESIIKGIKEIKQERHDKKPFISVRTLVNNQTCYDLHNFVSYWKGQVDEILFQPIHSNPLFLYKIPEEMQFKQKEKETFEKYFSKLLKEFKFIDNPYHRGIPDFLFDKNKLKQKINCFAGFFFMDIDVKGNVFPCGEHHMKIGNLQEKSLAEIWNNKKINNFRKAVKFKKNRCICWYSCSILNAYLTKLLKWS